MTAFFSLAQNVRPERASAWRHVVYACMQPAALAGPGDLARKREAWDGFRVTTHWPATNVELFPDDGECARGARGSTVKPCWPSLVLPPLAAASALACRPGAHHDAVLSHGHYSMPSWGSS